MQAELKDIPSLLRQVPLFSGMDASDLEHLATVVRHKAVSKASVVFREGDPGDEFLVVVEGSVKIELNSEDGKELTLAILRPYQFLGELSLLDDFPRSATVVALEDCRFLVISKADFHRVVDTYPRMGFPILRALTRRIRLLTDDIASMAFMDSFTRIARKLVALAQDMGQTEADGSLTIPQPLTHQDLANLVGTTRETVTKVLNEMKAKGLITINRHRINIRDKKRFADRANLPSFSI
jgi:CRP/FNR family cyclic AMP-dependent transcriptional regulator